MRLWTVFLYLPMGAVIVASIESAGVLLVFCLMVLTAVTGILLGGALRAVIRAGGIMTLCLILPVAGTGQEGPVVPPPPGDSLALSTEMAAMEALRVRGGWEPVPSGPLLRYGDRSARVPGLRLRLRLAGDLAEEESVRAVSPDVVEEPERFDAALERAIRRFQARHGLEVDGVVGPATLTALNVPVEDRIRQVQVNLARRREFAPEPAAFTILVNVPAFVAFLLDEGREPAIRRVIVGRVGRPTPILSGRVEHVVLAPYWNVPPGILRNDKLPEIRRDPSYLERSRISVMDRSTQRPVEPGSIDWSRTSAEMFNARYWLRQEPGPENALGLVKFIFPNPYHAFLHDTPDRHLFDRGPRAFSSGCIRLEGAMELAHRLLEAVPGWTEERARTVVNRGRETWIRLPEPVPIHTVYWTAWVDREGTLHLVDDLYGHDRQRPGSEPADPLPGCGPT